MHTDQRPAVSVLVLGQVQVERDGQRTSVDGGQQAVVLALLAARLGRVVPTDQLIDEAWEGQPPPSAAAAIRVHLAKIRALLASGDSNPLRHTGGGYQLDPLTVDTDIRALEGLVTGTRHASPDDRIEALEAALRLWRGEPFAGVRDVPALRHEAERLAELRLKLQDELNDLLLDQGRHVELAPRLATLVQEQPLREHRTRQLMLALYRSGRQADALAAYARLRDELVDELGVDPTPETRRLELAILRQEPSLTLARRVGEDDGWASPATSGVTTTDRPRSSPMLRDLLSRRLAALPSSDRRFIAMTAILGDLADDDVLCAALGDGPVEVEDAASRAHGAGLFLSGSCRFARGELRSELIAELEAEERRELHRGAALALESTRGDSVPCQVAAAWHRVAAAQVAGRTHEADVFAVGRAIDLALTAGRAELARDLCLGLLDPGLLPPALEVDMLSRLVTALAAAGQAQQAEERWRHGVEVARATGDAERFALMVLSRDWTWGSVLGAEGPSLLSEVLDALGPQPSALRVRVSSALVMESSMSLRATDLEVIVSDLVSGARALGDLDSLRAGCYARHVQLRPSAHLDERLVVAEQLRSLTPDSASPEWRARTVMAGLFDAFVAGDLTAAHRLTDEFGARAAESRSPRLLWHHALTRATLARELGDFEAADRWADDAMVQGATAGIPDALGAGALHALLVLLHRSSLAQLRATIDEFAKTEGESALLSAARALAAAQAGVPADARAACREALDQLGPDPGADELWGLALGLLTETFVLTGPDRDVPDLIDRLAPYSGQFVTFGQVTATFGPVDRILGLLLHMTGAGDEALDRLRSASASCEARSMLPWEVRCAADRVRVLLSCHHARDASALAHRYRERAEALGLAPCTAMFATAR